MMKRRWVVFNFISLLSCGCVHPSPPLSVADPEASVKIPAIKQAVQQDNQSVLPQLVRDLDSDDAAVRFFAVQGLRRLTGEDLGYHFYYDKIQRRPYIELWQKWLREHRQSSMVDAHDKQ